MGSTHALSSVERFESEISRVSMTSGTSHSSRKPDWRRNANETELVCAAISGDHQAFTELCDRCGRFLQPRIFRIVGNREDAEDALQETLLRAYQHLETFRGSCTFQTWITQIAINTALMVLRKRKTRSETSLEIAKGEGQPAGSWDVPDPCPTPEQVYFQMQASLMLKKEISSLPPSFRPVVEHFHVNEMRMIEVAKAVGISVGAAKSRLLRARTTLRRRLRKQIAGYVWTGQGVGRRTITPGLDWQDMLSSLKDV